MALSAKWFQGLEPQETKEEREKRVRASLGTLRVLSNIIRKEHDAALKKQQSPELFSHAAWPYEQADLNGYMRALRSILEMTDLTED